MKILIACILLLAGLPAVAKTVRYDLNLSKIEVKLGKKARPAMAINGSIPGPVLRFVEGDFAIIHVRNDLHEETSIHWHGLLVPNDQDGVPHVNMAPIKAGETREYRFPLRQSGTYWYHSHSVLQEQLGIYGGIVISPKGGERVSSDRDVVAVLSDWTDEKPFAALTQLRASRDWQQIKKGTAQSVTGAIKDGSFADYFKRSMMRMPPMDLSDIAYDNFLTNGKPTITVEARAGETVRLRLINASAMTYYFIEFAGGPVKIIAADGMDVRPVSQGRFLMAIAETYDLQVNVPSGGAYELRATAQDGTGATSVFVGTGQQVKAPDVPRANPYKGHAMMGGMAGMSGMDHSTMKMPMSGKMDAAEMEGMDHSMHDGGAPAPMEGTDHSKHGGSAPAPMEGMDHSKHGGSAPAPMEGMDHSQMKPADAPDHAAMGHAMASGERPGSPYESLKAIRSTALSKGRPLRTYDFKLQGDMIRYVWTLNGKTFTEADLVNVRKGERVQFVFTNETMMHHPMHLHGHFFRVLTSAGNLSPLKHTVDVPPMTSRTIEFAADEPGDWLMHCHVLYHAEVGMGRIIHYEDAPPNPNLMVGHGAWDMTKMHDPIFFFGEVAALSNMTEGFVALENNRNGLSAAWEVGWGKVEETEYEVDLAYDRYLNSFTSVFAGANLTDGESGDRGVLGVRYLLPFLIRSQAWVDTDGEFRASLSQSIPLTSRLSVYGGAEYDTLSGWQTVAGLEYVLDKRFSLIGQWHSEYGWGGGIGFRF